MRTLIHLSDLHFGRIQEALIRPLIDSVAQLNPDVIAVSGDLTQRARDKQFQAARYFLDALPAIKIVVPGNHDVPLYNVAARLHRLKRYRRHITDDLEPFYSDHEIAVLGMNTARSLTFKGGRINDRQVARMKERLSGLADTVAKVVVTHHPFDLPEAYPKAAVVGRAPMAINRLRDCRVDLFLAGHFHVSSATPMTFSYAVNGYSSLIVQAGTAISTRTRGEANAFNVILIDVPYISVERREWNSEYATFGSSAIDHFQRAANGWQRVPKRGR